MNKISRVLLFILALIGIVFSICVLSIFSEVPYITDALNEGFDAFPWFDYVFVGGGAFTGVCFFLMLATVLFAPGRSGFLSIEKGKGKLLFSKKTVESTAKYSFAGVDGISGAEVRAVCGRKPDKTRIYVRLSLADTSELISLTGTVQSRIESAMQDSLGIAVKSVEIKVIENNSGGNVIKDNKDNNADSGVAAVETLDKDDAS